MMILSRLPLSYTCELELLNYPVFQHGENNQQPPSSIVKEDDDSDRDDETITAEPLVPEERQKRKRTCPIQFQVMGTARYQKQRPSRHCNNNKKNKVKSSINRWSGDRYKRVEESMLEILKEKEKELLMLRRGYDLVGAAVMMNLSWRLGAYTRASSFAAVRKPPSLPITFCPCALLSKVQRSVTLKITLVIEVSLPEHPTSELLSPTTTLIMAPAESSSHTTFFFNSHVGQKGKWSSCSNPTGCFGNSK